MTFRNEVGLSCHFNCLIAMCGLLSPPRCNLKWKQAREMCREYCIHTGFWLTIPTGPTPWNSFVIIIRMTFMHINTVVVELCPHVNLSFVLPFGVVLKW